MLIGVTPYCANSSLSIHDIIMGLPAHETLFGVFRFKLLCLQIFSLKHHIYHISGVEYGKTALSSDLQMLKFGSSNLHSQKSPKYVQSPVFRKTRWEPQSSEY